MVFDGFLMVFLMVFDDQNIGINRKMMKLWLFDGSKNGSKINTNIWEPLF